MVADPQLNNLSFFGQLSRQVSSGHGLVHRLWLLAGDLFDLCDTRLPLNHLANVITGKAMYANYPIKKNRILVRGEL